jgi:hypothetical protein
MLGASIRLIAPPPRRRVIVLAVVVTMLWSALLALGLASELVGQSNPNVGLEPIALIIGGLPGKGPRSTTTRGAGGVVGLRAI